MNDGGTAFPASLTGKWANKQFAPDSTDGMSLRDWFAGTIALTNFDERLIEIYRADGPKTVDETIEYIARIRGRHADAMLADRDKKLPL